MSKETDADKLFYATAVLSDHSSAPPLIDNSQSSVFCPSSLVQTVLDWSFLRGPVICPEKQPR
jgi:hypothetical protein